MDKRKEDGSSAASSSTRPYLIRALHDWCTDNGFTPYLAVHVDRFVQVPMEYVSNNEIVLNVGFDATSGLELGNEVIQFKARFGGVAREIVVPVDHVVAIYARENGQGMAFPPPNADAVAPVNVASSQVAAEADSSSGSQRPATPLRGLRLAPTPTGDSAADDGASAPPELEDADGPFDDPSGPAAGTGRPSLKRIK